MSEQPTPPTEAELAEWKRNHWDLHRIVGETCEGNRFHDAALAAIDAGDRLIAEVRRLRAERSAVWLIEHIRGANGAPLWWCGSIPPFSADPNSAVRFVRERDAHVVMVQENIQNSCRATEHVFIDAAPQGRTP